MKENKSISDSLKSKISAKQDSIANKGKITASDTSSTTDTTQKEPPKRDIETTIEYSAEDSIVIDAEGRTAFLYKDSKIKYGNKNITANTIDMNYKTNVVTAVAGEDSLGKKIGVPIFEEGSDKYEAQQIKYNYKSKKGQVKGIVTKQGEGVVRGQVVKKEPDNTMFVDKATYTTCDLREPHFCIKATRIKFVAGKKIVTKAFNLQLDDIPTPLAFPFGIFPMTRKRASGIIIPSYTDNAARGLGLLGGGFYWAVNNYVGARMSVDAYTNGGATWLLNTDYRSRYSFTGNMNFQYADIYQSRDNPTNQGKSNSVWIRWSHSTLSKGSGRFSANVNMGSSGFNNNTQNDIALRSQGTFSSNVSYSNEIRKTPFNYGINFRQDQNVRTGLMNVAFPEASLNMRSIYPLKEVPGINKLEPIKKLRLGYSSTFNNKMTNTISPYNPGIPVDGTNLVAPDIRVYNGDTATFRVDSLRYIRSLDYTKTYYLQDTLSFQEFFNRFKDNARWNMTHSIPISTSIKFLKFFSLNPGISYKENWYDREYSYQWNADSNYNIKTEKRNFDGGLKRTMDYNANANITTRIYGTFYVKKWNIEGIRHTVIPTVGYTYTPDMTWQNEFEKVRIGNSINPNLDYVYINRYTGARGTPKKESQNLSFSLQNTLEMKVRDKKDTTKIAYKKIMLLESVQLSGSYNLKADSFALSAIPVSARTRLLMFDINFSANYDPYFYSDMGTSSITGDIMYKRTSDYAFGGTSVRNNDARFQGNKVGLNGAFLTYSLSVGTTFKPKKDKKPKSIAPVADGTDYYFMAIRSAAPYIDWDVPWSLTLNYVMGFNRFTPGPSGLLQDKTVFSNNIQMNGDLSLTQRWRLTLSTSYDFNKKNIAGTRIMITRDLHCWQASFSYNFFPGFTTGATEAFIATIGIKSAQLKDLKYERRSQPF